MSVRDVPTAASLRVLIDEVLGDDVDFDGFCQDHFEDVHGRFTIGMQHQQKVSLLLRHANRKEVFEFLCLLYPKQCVLSNWEGRIEWETEKQKVIRSARRQRQRRLRDILQWIAVYNWIRRLWVSLSPEWRTIVIGAVIMTLSGYGFAYLTSVPFPSLRSPIGSVRGQRRPISPKVPYVPIPNHIPPHPIPDGGQPWMFDRTWIEPGLQMPN